MTMQAHRYAIYLAPAEPFRTFGAQWLGRDADTGAAMPLPAGMAERPAEWVEAPAHYALHATLKPPFRLADGTDASMLDAAARAFAHGRKAFDAPLTLRALRGFLAWCLDDGDGSGGQRMHELADDCMRAFERFRAPATVEEMNRRRPHRLTDVQRAMLDAWGYPYAFDTFTFHITLTGMLDAASEAAAFARLSAGCGKLLESPLHVDGISVFVQPAPGADFFVARHFGFDGTTIDGAGAPYLQA
jgi:putative phosphonate metabolism protein